MRADPATGRPPRLLATGIEDEVRGSERHGRPGRQAGRPVARAGPTHLSDLLAVWRLGVTCFSDDGLPCRLGVYLTGGHSTVLTVWQRSRLAGFAVLRLERERGRHVGVIVSLGVDPVHRGNGIGRRLLREAHRWCRQAGAERIRLGVARDNGPALALCRSQGYRMVGRLLHYYGVGRDGLRMERSAPPREPGGWYCPNLNLRVGGGPSWQGRHRIHSSLSSGSVFRIPQFLPRSCYTSGHTRNGGRGDRSGVGVGRTAHEFQNS
jgi:ribosomal protein S18 acetylase RimI-like enzyme